MNKVFTMNKVLIAALLAASLGAGVPALAADSHSHDSQSQAAPHKLSLDHGKKWATDEPLRKGMGDIRGALAAKVDAIHKGKLSAAEYKALGATVEKNVGDIVANCKLPPEADANLHIVVAELVAAADAMQGKSDVKPAMGAERAVRATNEYAKYFNHPGFKPLGADRSHAKDEHGHAKSGA